VTNRYPQTSLPPRLLIDPAAIAFRLETLDNTRLCDPCRQAIIPVTGDTVALLIEALRLHDALTVARLESANRLAAMQAALRADRDGEADPLDYLRDELPPDTNGGWCR